MIAYYLFCSSFILVVSSYFVTLVSNSGIKVWFLIVIIASMIFHITNKLLLLLDIVWKCV